jgi:hypothetical protein
MRGTKQIVGGTLLGTVAVCLLLVPGIASSGSAQQSQAPHTDSVPAHHETAPTGPLPATLDPSLFTEPVAQNAYSIAARIKKVLYQQPCYCHCDRSQGHGSLLDCFTAKHAAECGVCVGEDFYAYEQTQKGKTPAQIREGIERGEWRSVDLKKYNSPPGAKSAN